MTEQPYRIKGGLIVEGDVQADNVSNSSPFLDDLADVDTSTTPPSNGQTLLYDSDSQLWKPGSVSGGGGGSLTQSVISHTTESLEPGAIEDFTIPGGDAFHLLSVTASTPSWVRIYGTSTARSSDNRSEPGGTPPGAGNDYYAELATVATPQTIRFSPVPLVQGTGGNAFIRVKNMDTVSRTIDLDFSVTTLISSTP